MWPYFLLYFGMVVGALSPARLNKSSQKLVWFSVLLFVTFMIGLRHEVGGDWFRYEASFYRTGLMDLATVVRESKDPGYYSLGWVVARWGGNVYLLNLLCAALLVWGVIRFSRAQPRPWLAMVAAVPYLLIVVGMGYTRQAAAIGLAMIALVALSKGQMRQFVGWVFVGALFHKSAVLLLPVAALAATKNRVFTAVWVSAVAAIGAWLFVVDSSDALWTNYVESDYSEASEGGYIRVAMNAVPALLLLAFRKKFILSPDELRLWSWMALISIACVPLLLISVTAVDRVALYFIPLQLFVASRLPLVTKTGGFRAVIGALICAYYFVVLLVWLYLASHSDAWIPYAVMPL